tara:strand:- start:6431 stop:6931 length:501 start_codon:yes stop_codon:yes gene_type:complete
VAFFIFKNMKQSKHIDFESETHNLDIVLVCDKLESPANIGGVLRLADAFGVSQVVFLGGKQKLSPRAKSVSRGTEKYLDYRFVEKIDFDERDWFCLELSLTSKPIRNFSLTSQKIGIVVGNEKNGVREQYLSLFPCFHIPMFGNNSSMNVASALSAALFHLTGLNQ